MRVSANEATNRFGSLSAQAKREPVFVGKAGQLDTVVFFAEHHHGERRANPACLVKDSLGNGVQ